MTTLEQNRGLSGILYLTMLTPRAGRSGFSLLETIISITILSFLLLAVFSLIVSNLATLFTSKARATGIALAQEKIEDLKNLSYDSLATQTGTVYPPGTIRDDESVTRNNIRFRIHTDIRYVDNDYDGNAQGTVVGKPVDIYPYDYKKITVQVYAADTNRKYAELSSEVAAKAAETAGNTGVLIVKVIDASGQPVDQAAVTITNPTVAPAVNIQTTTDILGQVIIPKLAPDAGKDYHIVVTKAGFSTDQTYPTNGTTPTPTNPDFAMAAQQTVSKTFAIDQLTNLSVALVDTSGQPVANRVVTIHGQKTINSTPQTYKYSANQTSDSGGQVNFNLIEWDSFSISVTGMSVLSSSPYQPVTASPNSSASARLVVAPTPTSFPVITSITPDSASPANVSLDITGSNLSALSTVVFKQAGQADRPVTGISYSTNTLSGTISLSGATGSWDVIVTTAGKSTTQAGGFSVQ